MCMCLPADHKSYVYMATATNSIIVAQFINSLFTIRKPVRVQVLKIFGGAREVGDNN